MVPATPILPYFESKMHFPLRAMGETALDRLQCLFQRDFRCRGQQQMGVTGHDYKFMQQKPPLSTILRKNIHEKLSHVAGLEKRAASDCRRGSRRTYVLIRGAWGIFARAKAR